MRLSRYNRLAERVARKEAQLDLLYDVQDKLTNREISSFELNTGEADQRVVFKKAGDVQDIINRLEKEIDHIYRSLQGQNLMRFTTNRRL